MLVLRLACVVASSAALAAKRVARSEGGFSQPPPADDRREQRLARVWPAGAKVDVPAAPTWESFSGGDAVDACATATIHHRSFSGAMQHWCPYCQSVEIVLAGGRLTTWSGSPVAMLRREAVEFVDVAGVDATLPVLIVTGALRLVARRDACIVRRGGSFAETPASQLRGAFSTIERELATAYEKPGLSRSAP